MLHKEKQLSDVYLIITKNIKKYRIKNRLTQAQLAEKIGYSYAYIRRLESSKCPKYFSIETIYNLSHALNIDIKQLFEGDDI